MALDDEANLLSLCVVTSTETQMVYLRYGMIFLFLALGALLAIVPSGVLGSREALKGAATPSG